MLVCLSFYYISTFVHISISSYSKFPVLSPPFPPNLPLLLSINKNISYSHSRQPHPSCHSGAVYQAAQDLGIQRQSSPNPKWCPRSRRGYSERQGQVFPPGPTPRCRGGGERGSHPPPEKLLQGMGKGRTKTEAPNKDAQFFLLSWCSLWFWWMKLRNCSLYGYGGWGLGYGYGYEGCWVWSVVQFLTRDFLLDSVLIRITFLSMQ